MREYLTAQLLVHTIETPKLRRKGVMMVGLYPLKEEAGVGAHRGVGVLRNHGLASRRHIRRFTSVHG